MSKLSPLFLLLVIGQMVALSINSVWGQPLEDQRDAALDCSISYGSIYQLETDLEEQGSFDASRQSIHAEIMGPFVPRVMAGLDLMLGVEEWDFTDLTTVAGATTWDTIYRHSISLPVFYGINDKWNLGMIPTVQYSGVSGAEQNDSLIYGGAVLLNYIRSRDLQLGIGLCAFSQLEETVLMPYFLIDWKVNDHLRISNPPVANPVGPAGLEVVYTPAANWEFAIGGAMRYYRFRLSEDNAVSGGIGQNEAAIAFLRMQRKLGTHMNLNLFGGASFDGKLSIEDSSGRPISSEEYESAPMVALQLAWAF